jgi:2'-5' RNA ligase
MGSDSIEPSVCIRQEDRLNVFALVIYIPGELGKFLDKLRRELVPGCNPHAHVSLLPPRPLSVDWKVAADQVRTTLENCQPFEIDLSRIEVFPVTDVIYLEVGRGAAELYRVHEAINAGALGFQDPFPYHPHVTLAQQVAAGEVAATTAKAERLWREYTGPRRFPADLAAFVQNSVGDCWIDLAEYSLGGSPVKS